MAFISECNCPNFSSIKSRKLEMETALKQHMNYSLKKGWGSKKAVVSYTKKITRQERGFEWYDTIVMALLESVNLG